MKQLALSILLLVQLTAAAQFQVYHGDTLVIDSTVYPELSVIDLQVPDVLRYAEGASYKTPLIILFDRQNASTYEYNLSTINYLTGAGGQMPPVISAGIEFPQEARLAMTRADLPDENGETGTQRTARYLFTEVIPAVKARYPGITDIIIVGHSRTAHLVNWLAIHEHQRFHAALSFSGFIEEATDWDAFEALAKTPMKRPFHFCFTAGESYEEVTYLDDCQRMDSILSKKPAESLLAHRFTTNLHANHITNYGMSFAQSMIYLFGDYSQLLGKWFFERIKTLNPAEAIKVYREELAAMNFRFSPSDTHMYSLGSQFLFEKPDAQAIRDFMRYGLSAMPNDPGLWLFLAEASSLDGNETEKAKAIDGYHEALKKAKGLTAEEREDLSNWYLELTAP
jgi:enterochelin esterase-like enzyme